MADLEQLRRDKILAAHLSELDKKHVALLQSVGTVKALVESNKGEISRILNLPKGDKGDRGPIGPQGIPAKPAKDGKDGKDGFTPVKGVDYLTKQDKEEILLATLQRIRQPKDGENAVVDEEKIANSVIDLIKSQELLSTEHIKGLRSEMSSYRNQMALRQAGQHGGGDTVVAGSGISLTRLPNGTTQVNATGGGTGTVTDVSIVPANGFSGSVATSTSTPAITLTTTVTGLLKGNGTAISAAIAGTDYQAPIILTTTGSSGAATLIGNTLNIPQYTGGGGGGDVVGPASAVNNRVVFFDGATGKLIKDLGLTLSGTNTGDQTTITGNAGTATALQTARIIGTITGDATSAGSFFDGTANNTNALTLATVNSDVGTFASVTVNGKGLVTAATALSGDVTSSGAVTTLATVNANVGTFGSATAVGTFTVNAKGLITAASNVTITPAIGSITGLGTGVATALAVNVGTAGAFVVKDGALGTPSSGVATNLTGTASGLTAGTVTGFTAGVGTLTGPAVSGVAVTLGNAETITGVKTMSGLNVITHSSSGLIVRNPANTFSYIVTGAAITADRQLNLPLTTTTDTLVSLGLAQTFTGAITFNNASVLAGAATMALFNTTATTITFAGAATTLTIGGTPTTAITHNYSTNATAAATTKTINFGTGGAASSTTNINIGSTNGGTALFNSPRVSLAGNIINGYTATATAASTTTLTINSNQTQVFTGTTTQTVVLPTTTVVLGQTYQIVNTSTGNVTVQSSGANTIQILGAGMSAIFTALVATPTTAANWNCKLTPFTGQNIAITATANAATINLAFVTNSITNNSAATLTITLPTTGAVDGEMRIVRVYDFSAVTQTIAWVNTQNSTVTAPTTSNGSTTLPRTVGFQYNSASSLWRCIADA